MHPMDSGNHQLASLVIAYLHRSQDMWKIPRYAHSISSHSVADCVGVVSGRGEAFLTVCQADLTAWSISFCPTEFTKVCGNIQHGAGVSICTGSHHRAPPAIGILRWITGIPAVGYLLKDAFCGMMPSIGICIPIVVSKCIFQQ